MIEHKHVTVSASRPLLKDWLYWKNVERFEPVLSYRSHKIAGAIKSETVLTYIFSGITLDSVL